MNKWTAWYESLPDHTQQYLAQQAVWHDRDLVWVGILAFVTGVIVGIAV